MQEGRFKLYNPISDDAEIQEQIGLSSLIFATDENEQPIEGCCFAIEERLDDDHIKVFIRTIDEVWNSAGNYTAPQTTIVENEDGSTSEVIEDKPLLTLLEMKLTCSECGAEWWGLPNESGLCAECLAKAELTENI